MYCNQCGEKNPDTALYCIRDGAVLTSVSETVQLFREKIQFCPNCSCENGFDHTYCFSCGQSFENIKEKLEEKLKVPTFRMNQSESTSIPLGNKDFLAKLLDRSNLIHSLTYAGISIVAVLVLSFILASSINSFILDALSGELGPFIGKLKIVSMTEIFMLSHMAGVNYNASIMFFEGGLKTSSGVFILLIIPAIVLITIGSLCQRKFRNETMIERLVRCLSFAIPYGVIVGVISLFSGVSLNIADPTGFTDEGMTLSANYSFIEGIFNAICISFIFTMIGSMFSVVKGQKLSNHQYGMSISYAIRNTMIGLFIMLLAGVFLISSNDKISREVGDSEAEVLLGTQIGGYLWNVAQFGSVQFEAQSYRDNVEASYSLIGGPKASTDEEEFKEMFEGVTSTIWLLILVPIFLHFWAGRKLYQSSQGNILYEVGAYAVAFGIVNTIIVFISKLSVETSFDGVFHITLGFSLVGTFLLSSIFAMVVTYAAIRLTKRQGSQQQFGQSHSA